LSPGPAQHVAKKAKFNPKAWNMKLFEAMENPSLVIDDSDDLVVVIKDAFPKAKHHFLVLPREVIPEIKHVSRDHLDLLKHMKRTGETVSEDIKKKPGREKLCFRLGYHALPSMKQLHMHVISQDFDSACLKTKKHWNSFTSDFFLEADYVIGEIEKNGSLNPDKEKYEALLKLPLKCHVCGRALKNMPELKNHLIQHNHS
jgi:aprataxin